ncbi:hypothetical protein ACKWTF_010961 [Chironomus riparius]
MLMRDFSQTNANVKWFHRDVNKFIFQSQSLVMMRVLYIFIVCLLIAFVVPHSNSDLNCTEVDESAVKFYRENVCRLPKIIGSCKLKQKRFFYNRTSHECSQFYYEGCAGNRNNFKTKSACECACNQQFGSIETVSDVSNST